MPRKPRFVKGLIWPGKMTRLIGALGLNYQDFRDVFGVSRIRVWSIQAGLEQPSLKLARRVLELERAYASEIEEFGRTGKTVQRVRRSSDLAALDLLGSTGQGGKSPRSKSAG